MKRLALLCLILYFFTPNSTHAVRTKEPTGVTKKQPKQAKKELFDQAKKDSARKLQEPLSKETKRMLENKLSTPLKQIFTRRKAQKKAYQEALKKHVLRRKKATKKPTKKIITTVRNPTEIIPLTNLSQTEEGVPTEREIKELIKKHWPDLGKISIKPLTEGASSKAVCAITDTQGKSILVVKISEKKGTQKTHPWQNLKVIQESWIGSFRPGLEKNKEAPILTPLEGLFSYIDNTTKKECIIEVAHVAQGNSIENLLSIKSSKTPKELSELGTKVGKAIGILHASFMLNASKSPEHWRTIIHGDLHAENIFIKNTYNQEYKTWINRIYLIDNETMRLSYDHPQKIDWDILAFFFHPLLLWEHLHHTTIPDKIWERNLSFYRAFLDGYLQAYPKERQAELSQYIKKTIFTWTTAAQNCIDMIEKNQKLTVESPITKVIWQEFSEKGKHGTYGLWKGFITFIKENKDNLTRIKKRLQSFEKSLE